MEKDLGKIKKNNDTDILIRLDDFGGKVGLTIREYVTSSPSGYKGFTKAGTRIPLDSIDEFKKILNSINPDDLKNQTNLTQKPEQKAAPDQDMDESSYL